MEASVLKLFLILTLFSISSSFGAERKESGSDLKKQYQQSSKRISGLKNLIKGVEKRLSQKNNKYIETVKKKRVIENEIQSLTQKQKAIENSLIAQREVVKGELKSLVLSTFIPDSGGILAQKVLLNQFKEDLKILDQKIHKIRAQKQILAKLENRFQSYLQLESDLASLLYELEGRKKIHVDDYLTEVRRRTDYEEKLAEYKRQMKSEKKAALKKTAKKSLPKTELRFLAPIQNYIDQDSPKKTGVNFYYRGIKRLTAPLGGTVAYAGDLSNYGQVVILEHGKETRSVVLGNFKPMVKKGETVQSGELIGKTNYSKINPEKKGKIYFEVRKKSVPLKTADLIHSRPEQQSLAKK